MRTSQMLIPTLREDPGEAEAYLRDPLLRSRFLAATAAALDRAGQLLSAQLSSAERVTA